MNLYIVGGKQKGEVLKDWQQYEKGLILKVDTDKGTQETVLEYQSPKEVCADGGTSTHFTAATIKNDKLYVGTQTEVMIYSLPDFQLSGYITLPCFNDIHHVRPRENGNLLVVNTGLDMVLEVTQKGSIIREWGVIDSPWERFSKEVDYRKVPSTKPHKSHPNYVFTVENDIFATRCHQKDAICLTNPRKVIDVGNAYIHDGFILDDSIYFTQVNGYIIEIDRNHLQVKRRYNLNAMTDVDKPLGWTRGIHVFSDGKAIVGFSRIRPSKKIREDGKEIRLGGYGVMPTRLACYDLHSQTFLWDFEVEEFGLNAIFSIHPVD